MKLEMTKKEDFFLLLAPKIFFSFLGTKKEDFPFLGTKKRRFPFLAAKKDDFLFWLPKKEKYLFLGGKNPFLVEKNCSVKLHFTEAKKSTFDIKNLTFDDF